MAFSDEQGMIPFFGQMVRKGDRIFLKRHAVVPTSMGVGVSAGDQAGAGRHTEGIGTKGIGEMDAFFSYPVHMGCTKDGISRNTETIGALLVRHD
jgi:hypothetical protein